MDELSTPVSVTSRPCLTHLGPDLRPSVFPSASVVPPLESPKGVIKDFQVHSPLINLVSFPNPTPANTATANPTPQFWRSSIPTRLDLFSGGAGPPGVAVC
jgi:hypothetical protein